MPKCLKIEFCDDLNGLTASSVRLRHDACHHWINLSPNSLTLTFLFHLGSCLAKIVKQSFGVMSGQRQKLEFFVKSILNCRNDDLTKQLSKEYSDRFMTMVQVLDMNEQTLDPGLKTMADEVFTKGVRFYHVLIWLLFCIELDKHCQANQCTWYTQEKLVEIIVNILSDLNFIPPPSYSLNICTII